MVKMGELRLLTPVLSPETTPVPKTFKEIVPDGALGCDARTKKVLPSPAAVKLRFQPEVDPAVPVSWRSSRPKPVIGSEKVTVKLYEVWFVTVP
jgi:hypothetical protein